MDSQHTDNPPTPSDRTLVRYRNRRTGQISTEQVPAERGLRFFYESPVGRLLRGPIFGNRVLSRLLGWRQDRPWSRAQIRPFVERFGIDLDEVELPVDQYPTFNAFFARRLKPGARPFAADPDTLCCLADGKALVFPELADGVEFPIKGASVTPASLLASGADAAPFAGGSALVVRLAPPDYHRFHFPDDGRAAAARLVPGRCHSVNPIALRRVPDLFGQNRRTVTRIDTAHFGPVAYVEVGAFAVASIVQTFAPGPVARGQEKGHFQFGGSTLALLFAPGAVRFDGDLVRDSVAGLETQVRAGERVGIQCCH